MSIPNLLRALVGPGGKRVTGGNAAVPNVINSIRVRVAIADIIAGLTLLSAVPGYKYRLVDCSAVAVGGAAGAVTTVDVKGTQATSVVKLVAFAQAQLTQSTVLFPGVTGAAVLADGASFVANDANTAITVGQTGSNITTATSVDITVDYVLEAA